jgi:hypothetical protein
MRTVSMFHEEFGYGYNKLLNIPNISLIESEFSLLKETAKGYWIISMDTDFKKWVPKNSKKRFAYPTKQEALVNFIKRTERRLEILESEIYSCDEALRLANKKINNEIKELK